MALATVVSPRVRLGLLVGLATLTRGEAIFLVPFAVAPLVLLHRALSWTRRLAVFALAAGVTLATLAPWTLYNLGRFEHPVAISTGGSGWLLGMTNCDATYRGEGVAFWSWCFDENAVRLRRDARGRPTRFEVVYFDETVIGARGAAKGSAYVRHHLSELPRVIGLRIARQWELFRPVQNAKLAADGGNDHRSLGLAELGLAAYYALLPIAAWGLVVMRRRGIALIPLVSMLVVVTVTAAISYGTVRFRVPAELALLVFAAAAITNLIAHGSAGPPTLVRRQVDEP